MERPILTTKLYLPPPPQGAISRPLLLAKLNRGVQGKLTLVTAPAGFGKSTLVSQWVQSAGHAVAWLTLDEQEREPRRFLTYLVAAIQQIEETFGTQTLTLLHSSQPPPLETLLTTLLNELALIGQQLLLVLDDYHLLAEGAIHELVDFLLAYLPPQIHLVLIGRHEPPLALARLRAQGALTEVHAAALRFSPSEVATFFSETMGTPLPPQAVATLAARTEGWAAGLRLAAMLLQTVDPTTDAEQFDALLATFRGDDQHLLDYLTAEVFDRLTTERQRFLVQTALLQRLHGPLCDAIMACKGSQAMLEALAREQLFLLPLDDQRQWYRYQPLFADFLRHRFAQLDTTMIHAAHGRAATWYGAHGFPEAAIEHALQAQDHAQMIQLLEAHVMRFARSNEVAALARWLQALPVPLSRQRPLLALAHAGVALFTAQFAEATTWIEVAEQALLALPPATTLPVKPQTIRGYLDALRSTAVVNLRGSAEEIIALAQRARTTLPADEVFLRGAVALNLGDAYSRRQAQTLAEGAFAEAVVLAEQAGNLTVQLAALGSQGHLYQDRGDLPQAAAIYRRAIAAGQAWGKATGQPHPATGKALAFYATILYEWNQLTDAETHATAAVACCKQWGHTQHLIDSYLALINSLFAQGKVAAATAALTAARLVATAGWHRAQEEGTQPIAAHELVVAIEQRQLQLWLRQGRWTDAAQWLADHATDEQPALCFARVRLALAHHQPAVAQHWLTHMQQRLSGHLSLSGEVKLLLLQAQWHQQQGDLSAALVALRAALTLAEPSGHLRVFLDEGAAVAALLHRLVQAERGAAYAQRLCALFGQQESLPAVTEAAMPAQPPLVEPLSARELDVLQLIAVDLTYEAIGEQLSISLNTVRTHTKNIYSKLNVNRRQQAVTRARLLGLLP